MRRSLLLLVCLPALALSSSRAAALTLHPGPHAAAPARLTPPGAWLWRFVNPLSPEAARDADVSAADFDPTGFPAPGADTTSAGDAAAAHSGDGPDPWKVRNTLFAQAAGGNSGAGASRPGPRDGPTPAGLLVHVELNIPGATARLHLDGGPLRLTRHPGKVFRPPKG